MPQSKLGLKEAAEYLDLSVKDLQFLVEKGKVPHEMERNKFVFRKGVLRDWANQFLFSDTTNLSGKKHHGSFKLWSKANLIEKKLGDWLLNESMEPFLPARTKPSVLRELVNVAAKTGMLSDPTKLLGLLRNREELGPTGLKNGIAIPHPRIHTPDLCYESFMVIAKVPGGIPFGSLDGENSDLFFMPCAQTEEDHIFMLGRLTSMIKKTDLCQSLRDAKDAEEMISYFQACEEKLI
ncbi:MAG: PTS sugar transporter subunit IIA [Candidatus Aureabacteria bacterium]|nr:PTS sugar transporter subunit IIA [Candidatus Auribacterota bacterium]